MKKVVMWKSYRGWERAAGQELREFVAIFHPVLVGATMLRVVKTLFRNHANFSGFNLVFDSYDKTWGYKIVKKEAN